MLPECFVQCMIRELGEREALSLARALEDEPSVALRVHPLKGTPPLGERRVPWSEWGYYLARRPLFTLDPAFHAGCYYVQEPSSQFVGWLAAQQPIVGARVLDLCAAPGGKTTLYASLAGPRGLVVANEIDRRRAQTLVDNVRKWGMGNVAVTVGDAAPVCALEEWFDLVAVDAPCSGEGMFRKDPASRDEWSEGNVRLCAARQGELLDRAWRALRPGGMLLYSTCTFNRTEDEATLEAFVGRTEGLAASATPDCDPAWGVAEGRVGPFATYRFFPDRCAGEGFFAAVACKEPGRTGRPRLPKGRKAPLASLDNRSCGELRRWLVDGSQREYVAAGDTVYAWHAAQAGALRQLAQTATVIYSGVEMGQLYGGRLKPAHALALDCALDRRATALAEVGREQALDYLRRAEVAPEALAEGINLLTCEGAALGFAKRIGRRVNNLYPQSLRIVNK